MTEDKVRESAGKILGFKDTETAKSGVGQITSFNQLGFKGVKDRPDDVIYKQSGDDTIQWLDPNVSLSYKVVEKPFDIKEQDFKKNVLDYIFFKSSINPSELKNKVLEYVLYDNVETVNEPLIEIIRNKVTTKINRNTIDITKWKKFQICGDGGIFKLVQPKPRKLTEYLHDGDVAFVASGAFNNGIEKYVKTDEELDKGNCITVSAKVCRSKSYLRFHSAVILGVPNYHRTAHNTCYKQ